MASVESLVAELKVLSPDQLEQVARIVHELSAKVPSSVDSAFSVVSDAVLEQAIQNGWPAALFTEVIGRIDGDFERPPQVPNEVRQAL